MLRGWSIWWTRQKCSPLIAGCWCVFFSVSIFVIGSKGAAVTHYLFIRMGSHLCSGGSYWCFDRSITCLLQINTLECIKTCCCTKWDTAMIKNIGTLDSLQKIDQFSQKSVVITNALVLICWFLLCALKQHKKAEKKKLNWTSHQTEFLKQTRQNYWHFFKEMRHSKRRMWSLQTRWRFTDILRLFCCFWH